MVSVVPCLLDGNVASWLRVTEEDPFGYVGSTDLAVSRTIVAELQATLPADDRKALGNLALIARLGNPIIMEDEGDWSLAADIERRYAKHQPAPIDPADLVIAATAILHGRVLVTRNWKHFHFIEGLRMIDARLTGLRDLVQTAGIIECAPNQACCEGILRGR